MSRPISVRATRRGTPTVRIGSLSLSSTTDTVVDLDDPNVLRDLHRFSDAWVTSVATDGVFINAKDMGAKGDGSTDDTAALTAAINRLNTSGGILHLPFGQYMISSPLPTVTNNAVLITGTGWAQTSFASGSVISAAVGFTGTMLTLAGEGIEVRNVTVDGGGRGNNIAITGANCRLTEMSTHGTVASGVAVDGQTGSASLWITNCRINGINFPNTAIQLNDTDAIITGCKPTNCSYGITLLSGASGALIANNHITNGAGGITGAYINGNPSHVHILGNRFDNYVQSAVQIIGQSAPSNSIKINDNHFHSTVMTDNTYAIIAVDTSAGGVRALQIVGNDAYGASSHQAKNFLSAAKADGTTATNTSRLASLGTTCSGNIAWAASAFQGFGAPTVARGNMTATDGQTYGAVVDV